jgi:uncharacterized RDD family membrane protein YckC
VVDPPPLPKRLSDVPTVVATGTGLWALAAVVLLAGHLLTGGPLGLAFTTCVAGALLGVLGFLVFGWQRSAARRGSRTAQDGVD